MERIVQPDNLMEAWLLTRRGKQRSAEVRAFGDNLDRELSRMAAELLAGCYSFGRYRHFTIYDPKKRIISAAPFRDRVVMQAMMRICHPVFDNYQIFDSYASRRGKGTYAAIARARQMALRHKWFAKMDVRNFFYSISHEVMTGQLERLFKDRLLLSYFSQLIDSYSASKGRGLPIGNLTSQYFANHNLAEADHYAKEQLRIACYVRYMDDILLFADDRDELMTQAKAYETWVGRHLRLEMHDPVVNRCGSGLPFLGYVIHGHRLSLSQRSRRRLRKKMSGLTEELDEGLISESKYRERLTAMYAFAEHADVVPLKRKVMTEQGFLP